eukprot:TRINITY_DN4795_c0_g1_i1.p1 TRINITY_DN4795_c0_g1~~TRINITY_DN4795_c0_g1_i1.p1  ORF type:complete len:259 (+),score=88.91 TRINITY_DN4795_c0_g1_i1:46-822(+)
MEYYTSTIDSVRAVRVSAYDRPLLKFEEMVGMNVAYLVIVLFLRVVMSSDNIKAFDLKWFRAAYNLACVILSGVSLYMVIVGFLSIDDHSLVCNNTEQKVYPLMKDAVYVFYLSKFFEFTDTFIMCLRKKFNQVSFLHVYHHASISAVVWAYLHYTEGGDEYLAVALNSFIHVLMYSHYFVTTFGVSAPWKALLTSLQLTQFMLIFGQAFYALIHHCGWPDFLNVLQITYMSTMLMLFGNFFMKSYVVPASPKKLHTE